MTDTDYELDFIERLDGFRCEVARLQEQLAMATTSAAEARTRAARAEGDATALRLALTALAAKLRSMSLGAALAADPTENVWGIK